MINIPSRRLCGRPKTSFLIAALVLVLYWILLTSHGSYATRLRDAVRLPTITIINTGEKHEDQHQGGVNTASVEEPNSEYSLELQTQEQLETSTFDVPDSEESWQERESSWQEEFEKQYKSLARPPGIGTIFGNSIAWLVDKNRAPQDKAVLKPSEKQVTFTAERPYVFNPYPDYNSKSWKASHSKYVPCVGATGAEVTDVEVFRGHPEDFPSPGFGSYSLLNLDSNLCFERETRLGQYGLGQTLDKNGDLVIWEKVNWGKLQQQCVQSNRARFDRDNSSNPFLESVYSDLKDYSSSDSNSGEGREGSGDDLRREQESKQRRSVPTENSSTVAPGEETVVKETRTAVLLRSYTGKRYNENDKQAIRSLITELSLRTGGEYQVFLLVEVKENYDIWGDDSTYQFVLQTSVPQEFWEMTILWTENQVREIYPKLDKEPDEAKVHVAQYLAVQDFIQKHREFEFVWNWEMDSRVIGHHYDMLTKLVEFARNQPRRGLWERNERFYIESYHGGYDTRFRKLVEKQAGEETIWFPPSLPFINPVGPKPPKPRAQDDNYEWGVNEEADLITVNPIFNPNNSNWILRDNVWGYDDDGFDAKAFLPRRATIVTQSRISKRLLDIMHVENLRGNHVASEMTSQTVALLHGLKAVYAPMPVFFDRPWPAALLAKWFNIGPKGVSGSYGSAFGWGREQRFGGSTWYYRADPPQRMYNNWMGYEDTGVGGSQWEAIHGRPCLPAMMLHPVKSIEPTSPGHSSESKLPY